MFNKDFCSFVIQDLTHLARLPFLRSLGLKSPIYSLSPVAVLCNYAIHVIYHLPQLTKLDNNDISGKAIKDLAEVHDKFYLFFIFWLRFC